MTTIIDYVRRATTPLRTDLTPADALILATLSYADFHTLAGPRSARGCLLREVAQASSNRALYDHAMLSEHNCSFCARGPRRPPAEGSADSGHPRPLRGLCEWLSAASDRPAPLPPMRTLTHLVAATTHTHTHTHKGIAKGTDMSRPLARDVLTRP